MAGMADHAKRRHATEGRTAAWLGISIAGATTVVFNVWHATHSGMNPGLGIVEGIAPVALAMVVSHLVATYRGGWFLEGVTFAVMLGAMALSVRATGTVVSPAAGPLWWLFGGTVDTAALVSLRILLSLKKRAADAAQEQAQADAAAGDERTALRAQLDAQKEMLKTAQAALEEAQATAQAEREHAASGAAQAAETIGKLTRKLEAATRKATPRSDRAKQPHSDRADDHATEIPADVDARREVLAILANEPDISGAKLGLRVGMSARWGQMVKNELAPTATPHDIVDTEGDQQS